MSRFHEHQFETLVLLRRLNILKRFKDARLLQFSKTRMVDLSNKVTAKKADAIDESKGSRISKWKWNKIKERFTFTARLQKLQIIQRVRREVMFYKNRGFSTAMVDKNRGIKTNLGNHLHITEKYNINLEKSCISQCIDDTKFEVKDIDLYIKSTVGKPNTASMLALIHRAETLVRDSFEEHQISINLVHTLEDNFITSIIFDKSLSVKAVVEYVWMKKYLWIESFTVEKSFRHKGIGRLLLQRLKDLASSQRKTVLLYSLLTSLQFYLACGFQLSSEFPFREGHHGLFLTISQGSF